MNVIVEENFELSKDYDNIVTHIHTYSYTRRFRPIVFRYWHDLMFCGLYHGNNFAILIHKFMFRLHPFGMWTSIWHRFLAAPNAVAMGSADSFQTIGSSLFIVSLKWILPNNEQLSIDLCDSSDQHLSILYTIVYCARRKKCIDIVNQPQFINHAKIENILTTKSMWIYWNWKWTATLQLAQLFDTETVLFCTWNPSSGWI